MTDIVIVNWNSGHFLKKCIDSIFVHANEKFVNKVFIIDNNSSDFSIADIKANDSIELILNTRNEGFSKACNQGFRKCTAEYVLLLNPDAMLLENTLSECHTFMDERDDVDIMGCSLLNEYGSRTSSCARFPTPARVFYDASGLSKVAPKLFTPATIMTDWDHLESRKVDEVMGAFMFMKKSVFEKIGYFDEQFFVYYEELDFSKRLSLANGVIFYNAAIAAIHTGEGTTQSVKAFRLYLNLQSRLRYAKKYFSVAGYTMVWLSTFFIEPFSRLLFLVIKGRFRDSKEMLKGFGYLIKRRDPVR